MKNTDDGTDSVSTIIRFHASLSVGDPSGKFQGLFLCDCVVVKSSGPQDGVCLFVFNFYLFLLLLMTTWLGFSLDFSSELLGSPPCPHQTSESACTRFMHLAEDFLRRPLCKSLEFFLSLAHLPSTALKILST